MTAWYWILACLFCYRLTVVVSRDKIFAPIRNYSPRLKPVLSCTFCTSIWLAAGIETAFYLSGVKDILVVVVAIVFSLSAITIILDRTFTEGIVN